MIKMLIDGRKQVTFTSGLHPDWKSGSNTHPKKSTHVQISAGGLDSDVEDIKPLPLSLSKSRTRMLSEEEVTKGAQNAKYDLSRRNEANICLTLIKNY